MRIFDPGTAFPQNPQTQFEKDLVFTLTSYLRSMMKQLNQLSDGGISACTTAQTAAPTGGTWATGDFIRNTTPVAGGVFGWVCIAGGTPGTWKPVMIAA